MARIEHIGDATLYLGDCLEVLPTLGKVDGVITDPPYPDWHVVKYRYKDGIIATLNAFPCKQFVFWSADTEFPLAKTAVHIWNKNPSNNGAQYEFIYERNGGEHRKVFTYYMVNSTVAASFGQDDFTGHPSQKPIKLFRNLINNELREAQTILDPFMGSGTTGVACAKLGRKFIGIEIDETYFDIACKRIEDAYRQADLFVEPPAEPKLTQADLRLNAGGAE